MSALLDSAVLISIAAATIRTATPMLFSAMGELITQRAGIWNMGVEGTMLMASFTAYLIATLTGSLALALLVALLAAALMGLLIAFLTATLRVDHFIAGLGLNLLSSGLTLFWFRSYIQGREQPTFDGFDPYPLPYLSEIPVIGPVLFSQHVLTYLAFLAVPLVWYFLYRTRFGLEFRCIGENPKALDVKGLSVPVRQYLAIIFGSVMTGLGGAFLMLGFSDRFLPEITAGRGWLVIVAIIAGNWLPVRIAMALLVFALLEAVAIHVRIVGVGVPQQIFLALPYVASIALIALFRLRSYEPAALGIPYRRE